MRDAAHVPAAARAAYPLRIGNTVRPLIDGEPAFRRISEAIESARSSVWATIAFIDPDVALPDGRGTIFDLLGRTAARGVDVRVLFWRESRLQQFEPGASHFEGTAEQQAWLTERRAGLRIRWDGLDDGFCQHQKSWLVDGGQVGEVAFVGGINPTKHSMSTPDYPARVEGHVHGLFLEISGPAATDVHHNFVQRWNGASERERDDGCWPDRATADELDFPSFISPVVGEIPVQITRTVVRGHYSDDTPTPGAKPFRTADGEQSVLEQYVSAIAAAERTIYMENQAIGSAIIVEELGKALARGVHVAFLVPGRAHPAFAAARRSPRAAHFFEKLAELGRFQNFTLAAIAANRPEAHFEDILVRAKIAVIDGAWATIGSTNIAERSFQRDTELNASFWHAPSARALLDELFGNLLGRPTKDLDDRDALVLFREIALRNCDRRTCWEPMDGFVYALDPAHYGV